MNSLFVKIEINGEKILVGNIKYSSSADASFSYDESYLALEDAKAISISLPLQYQSFSAEQTRNFFEGLLPEGFTLRSIAGYLHADENDYISILSILGKECLGALSVSDNLDDEKGSYKKLSIKEIKDLASNGIGEVSNILTKTHLSLTGASGKVGLYYNDKDWYLPIGSSASTHIVKQSHVRYDDLVVNEQLCLMTAEKLGIEVSKSFIINTKDAKDFEVLFATKRYDRLEKGGKVLRLHQEDFAQALGIPALQKYEREDEGYLAKMFDIIRRYIKNPLQDQLKLWNVLVFDYLIGNTDNHLKNFSLLYSPDLASVSLAPAYDMLSTIIYPESTHDMSLCFDGKYAIEEINDTSLLNAAAQVGIQNKLAKEVIEKQKNAFESALNDSTYELKEQGFISATSVAERIKKAVNW